MTAAPWSIARSPSWAPLALGAMTGRGFGRFAWTPDRVSWATDETVRAWIDAGAPGTWTKALTPVPAQVRAALDAEVAVMSAVARVPAALVCDVTLAFDHRFLVSEPGRVVTEAQAESRKTKRTAGIMPKVDAQGHAVLPTASIKGALRSRAERILATLTGDETPFDHAPGRGRAGLDDPAAVMMTAGLPTERLFGAASWRAALAIEPFEPVAPQAAATTQELVAIDRFTGGASGSAKYDIDAFDRPTFKGRLRLNLDRSQPEDVGLLVLLLRDLAEGDVTFGYGATKGFGGVAATVAIRMQGARPETWDLPWPTASNGPGGDAPLPWADIPNSTLDAPLRAAVAALRDRHCSKEVACDAR
jgi:CRISPR/Cas system CSM-associated protein Csm3 (group 7 of RAMP superfamily)